MIRIEGSFKCLVMWPLGIDKELFEDKIKEIKKKENIKFDHEISIDGSTGEIFLGKRKNTHTYWTR